MSFRRWEKGRTPSPQADETRRAGKPWTLGQAQEWLSESEVGNRIDWLQADPVAYLKENPSVTFDCELGLLSRSSRHADPPTPDQDAVLAHSLYYFASPSSLLETIALLAQRARKGVLLAEWSLTSSTPSSLPHLLAVLTQSTLETKTPKENTASNVRTVLSPARIRTLLTETGLRVQNEATITPGDELQDGGWEVSLVTSAGWETRARELLGEQGERELASVMALRDATRLAVERLGAQKVTSMDVWCARVTLE